MANKTFYPLTIILMRLAFSSVLLSLYLVIAGKFVKIQKADRKLFVLLALFEPFAYFIGESFSLTYVSATLCSVFISTIPVFATLGAWLLFREKLRPVNYAGIILSFLGVLVFVLNSDGSVSFDIRGLGFLFLAVISAVGYSLVLNKLAGSYSPVFIVNIQNIIGTFLFLPLFIILDMKNFFSIHFTFSMFRPVIELAVFASGVAFVMFTYALRHMGVAKSNAFSNIIPVLTAIFSFILLGERLTMQNITGMSIVIAGLFMSQINGRSRLSQEASALAGKTA
ncbi:MAG TPA: DMT family transporter, partial [Bacteroidales bacterium]|nr:DMT family transporter [Bacteroidales bacterium]